jgi:hypothetical protein
MAAAALHLWYVQRHRHVIRSLAAVSVRVAGPEMPCQDGAKRYRKAFDESSPFCTLRGTVASVEMS